MLRAHLGANSSSRPPSRIAARDVAHVVDRPVGVRHRAHDRIAGRARRPPARGALAGVGGQVVEQVAHEQRRVGVVGGDEVRDAVALVDLVAPELRGADVLAQHLAHDGGPGQEHVRALGHDHEVGQRRRIGAAARRGAADHADLRDAAAQRDVLAEDARVAGQRGRALLHAGAAGLDEADDRRVRAAREPQDAHDRVGVLLAQRPAEVRRVLGVAEDRPAVDAPGARDHAVARLGAVAHAAGHDVGPQQRQRAAVAQRLQPFDRAEAINPLGYLKGHLVPRGSFAPWANTPP